MKTNVLGIKSKYFLVLPFVLLLFAHYGNGQVISDTGETDTDKKPVACQYGSEEIEIFGNADCSQMFCAAWSEVECTYEDGEKKKHSLLCSADQNPDGSWTCPGAYACAVDEDHEYHEAFATGKSIVFDLGCEGAGILNMASGVLQTFSFPQDTPSTFILNPVIPSDLPPDPVTNLLPVRRPPPSVNGSQPAN